MKNIKYTFPALLVFLLLGFSGISIEASDMGGTFSGSLVMGHEVREFRPCDKSETYWVELDRGVSEKLVRYYKLITSKPYQPVYVKFAGVAQEPSNQSEFSIQYDGNIQFGLLYSISDQSRGDCVEKNNPFRTLVFDCTDESTVVVNVQQNSAWMFANSGTRQLELLAEDIYSDGHHEIFINGESATIVEGKYSKSCINNRKRAIWEQAKLNGFSFRAVGNEPGWIMKMRKGDRFEFQLDYGVTSVTLNLPKIESDSEKRISRWGKDGFSVEIRGDACVDTMSGDVFESTVIVAIGDDKLAGCGRALY